ncbi:hypothetical protein [Spirosoma aerophilum]
MEPALLSGTDILALYDDSLGASPCLCNVLIQFGADGTIGFRKPAVCADNETLTGIT